MKTHLAAAAVGLLTLVSQVEVAAAAPAWCKDAADLESPDLQYLQRTNPDDIDDVFRTIARALCKPTPEAQSRSADIEKLRANLSKLLGMNDADWADSVAYAKTRNPEPDIDVKTRDFATMSPIDQYETIREGIAWNNGDRFTDFNYLADVFEPNLTEVGRLAYIRKCIANQGMSPTDDAVQFAMCQGDIDAFDVAKFGAQLRTDTTHDGAERMRMRVRLYQYILSTGLAAEHKKTVAQIYKKDAAYKKLWDAAKAGRDEWKASFGGDTAGLALVQRMDGAAFFGSRKLLEGCQDTTGKALDAAITKHAPVKDWKNIHDTRKDPYEGVAKTIGPALAASPQIYWAAMPYILCQPKTQKADFLAYYIQDVPGNRGPRASAYTRMMTESVVLDDMNDKVRYPQFSRPYSRSGGTMGSAGGYVKSVKPAGDHLVVELEALPVKIQVCTKSHSTGRISRINWSSGAVEYGSVCDKYEGKTINDQWMPLEVNKKYAALIKKGVRISIVYGGQEGGADVIATWANKSAPLPNTVLGAPVK